MSAAHVVAGTMVSVQLLVTALSAHALACIDAMSGWPAGRCRYRCHAPNGQARRAGTLSDGHVLEQQPALPAAARCHADDGVARPCAHDGARARLHGDHAVASAQEHGTIRAVCKPNAVRERAEHRASSVLVAKAGTPQAEQLELPAGGPRSSVGLWSARGRALPRELLGLPHDVAAFAEAPPGRVLHVARRRGHPLQSRLERRQRALLVQRDADAVRPHTAAGCERAVALEGRFAADDADAWVAPEAVAGAVLADRGTEAADGVHRRHLRQIRAEAIAGESGPHTLSARKFMVGSVVRFTYTIKVCWSRARSQSVSIGVGVRGGEGVRGGGGTGVRLSTLRPAFRHAHCSCRRQAQAGVTALHRGGEAGGAGWRAGDVCAGLRARRAMQDALPHAQLLQYATEGSNPGVAGRFPRRSAAHACEPRLGQRTATRAASTAAHATAPPPTRGSPRSARASRSC
eukprot:scaffold97031_cov75-Phaeocystis_antarctica.AAC.3